jgi:hypothetical protein
LRPKQASSVAHEVDGFDRAVRYLGEHHAVLLAAVVDSEGLTMGSFKRDGYDPDQWAPYSLLFRSANEELLERHSQGEHNITQLDLTFGPFRLVVVNLENFNLLVLFNHDEDDLLGIRINQAADLIRKYTSERYGSLLSSGTEERYVSST